MLELGADKWASPAIPGLLIAKISEDRFVSSKAKVSEAKQPCFGFWGPERHAEGRDPSSGPEGHFWAIRATGAILGPKKATLRGQSSTLRGLRIATGRSGGGKS
jgi:hypothetical protein